MSLTKKQRCFPQTTASFSAQARICLPLEALASPSPTHNPRPVRSVNPESLLLLLEPRSVEQASVNLHPLVSVNQWLRWGCNRQVPPPPVAMHCFRPGQALRHNNTGGLQDSHPGRLSRRARYPARWRQVEVSRRPIRGLCRRNQVTPPVRRSTRACGPTRGSRLYHRIRLRWVLKCRSRPREFPASLRHQHRVYRRWRRAEVFRRNQVARAEVFRPNQVALPVLR